MYIYIYRLYYFSSHGSIDVLKSWLKIISFQLEFNFLTVLKTIFLIFWFNFNVKITNIILNSIPMHLTLAKYKMLTYAN